MSDDSLPVISLDSYRIERSGRYCGHRGQRTIDPEMRTITCDQCKAQLDPLDCLVQIARDRDHMVFRHKELKRDIARLEAKLADLKRNEANTRERLKRLSKKPMPLESAEGK